MSVAVPVHRRIWLPRTARTRGTVGIGMAMVGLVVIVAILAPWIAPYDPNQQDLAAVLLPPSPQHWIGTDQLGRDILSRLMYAPRTDLRVGAVAVIVPFVVGTALGSLAGYFSGWTQRVVDYVVNVVLAFPFYILVLAIVAIVGAGEFGIYVTYALVGWVAYARVIQGATSIAAGQTWAVAARDSGLPRTVVLTQHVLPNTIPQSIVFLFNDIVFVIVSVVTLSYLGLGIQQPTAEWGSMIADGQAYITTNWWMCVAPGLAVAFTGVGLSLIADGLTDRLGGR
jgi:peptide/nickel transport system permease protein